MIRKFVFLFALILIPSVLKAACPNGDTTHAGNECIVKANGTGSTCTEASPCAPGGAQGIATGDDQVWLRDDGGVYNGRFTLAFTGSSGHLVEVRRHCGADHICDTSDDHKPKFDSYFGTTLTAAIVGTTITAQFLNTNTTCSTPIPLADATGFSSGMTLFVESEEFTANTISGGSITNCTRPSASTHANGSGIGPGCNSVNISVASASGINNGDTMIIQNGSVAENINVLAKSGNNITNCFRAWDGTPPMARANGSQVDVVGTTITDDSDWTRFTGLEIYSSYPTRAFASGLAGDWTTKRGSCVFYLGANNQWVGNVLHDCNHGLFTSSSSGDLIFEDNFIYNQGLVNTDPNGLGWYAENTQPNVKTFRNNIVYGSYSSCGKLYSESLGNADNFLVDKIICYDSGVAIAAMSSGRPSGYGTTTRTNGLQLGGGGAPNLRSNTFSNNRIYIPLNSSCFYFGGFWIGYQLTSGTASNNSFTDNYAVACQTASVGPLGTNLTFTGNTLVQALTGTSSSTTIMAAFRKSGETGWSINNNHYYSFKDTETNGQDGTVRYDFSYSTASGSPLPAGCCRNAPGGGGPSGSSGLTFDSSVLVVGQSSPENGAANSPSGSGWKQWGNGFDSSSDYHGGSLPTTNVKGCNARTYGYVGGHCYIYNWEGLSTVALTVSGLGLSDGDSIAVYDASNWNGYDTSNALFTTTYSAGSPTVNIPMSTLTTVKKPIGVTDTITHTANGGAAGGFAALVVLKTSAGGGGGGGSSTILWIGAAVLMACILLGWRNQLAAKPEPQKLLAVDINIGELVRRIDKDKEQYLKKEI